MYLGSNQGTVPDCVQHSVSIHSFLNITIYFTRILRLNLNLRHLQNCKNKFKAELSKRKKNTFCALKISNAIQSCFELNCIKITLAKLDTKQQKTAVALCSMLSTRSYFHNRFQCLQAGFKITSTASRPQNTFKNRKFFTV